jgi:ribosomal protein S18 acetylase RimI-like enzyme
MQNFHIRCINQQELAIPLSWAKQEGWQPAIDDASHFYAADPQGFFMGFLGDEPIGSISAVAYDDSYGFIGLYIVRPEFRHQGFGVALWNTAIQRLQGRNMGLDGVIEQQSNYQKSGFKIAYRHLRFQTAGTGEQSYHSDIVALSDLPLAQVLAYDIFPVPRPVFLQSWLNQKHGTALGIVHHQQLVAYGVIRACHESFRIGPLFADSAELAEDLLAALLTYAPNQSAVFIDLPETNENALTMAQRHAMPLVFESARMYTQAAPKLAMSKIYGITSLELG